MFSVFLFGLPWNHFAWSLSLKHSLNTLCLYPTLCVSLGVSVGQISTCQMTHTLRCTYENCVAIVASQQRRRQRQRQRGGKEGTANGNQQLSAPRGVCGSLTRLAEEEAEPNDMQQRLRQFSDISLSFDSSMCYAQLPRIAASCWPCPQSRVDELTRDTKSSRSAKYKQRGGRTWRSLNAHLQNKWANTRVALKHHKPSMPHCCRVFEHHRLRFPCFLLLLLSARLSFFVDI